MQSYSAGKAIHGKLDFRGPPPHLEGPPNLGIRVREGARKKPPPTQSNRGDASRTEH